MASIEKRGESYRIKCSMGYDCSGKQVFERTTWKPEPGMSQKQIDKELTRQAVLFEEKCRGGHVSKAIKFEEFSRQWFDTVAVLKLKERTLANYHALEKRVYKAIGFMRMDKIQPRHIQRFILDLSTGERHDKYKHGALKPKTIKNHIALISTIFEHAIKMGIVSNNPCRVVTYPKSDQKEQEVYTVKEAREILALLHQEPEKNLHYVVYFTLAMFSGFRRGELLGLEFKDLDYDRLTVTINRTSNYTVAKGIFVDTPKTSSSYRTLKLPAEIMDLLKRFQLHKRKYAESLGNQWIEHDRLFTKWNGEPLFPNSPSLFFERFCKRHGIRYLCGHSFRHWNASAQILAGVDVKTVQSALGHSSPVTTLQIYSHAFRFAQAAAMDKIVDILGLPPAANL